MTIEVNNDTVTYTGGGGSKREAMGVVVLGGSGGSGGPTTIADGADVAEGARADTPYTDVTGAAAGTLVSIFKGVFAAIRGAVGSGTAAAALRIQPATDSQGFPIAGVTTAGARVSVTGRVGGPAVITSQANFAMMSATLSADVVGNQVLVMAVDNRTDGMTAPYSTSQANIPVVSFGALFNGASWDRQRKPNGFSRVTSTAATGSPTLAKSTAGDLSRWWGQNGSAITYLQIYNKASAPVIGTDAPVVTYPIPSNTAFSQAADNTYLSAGIAYAFTTDAAGTTAAAAGAVTSFALIFA